jgi:hypothetical protein
MASEKTVHIIDANDAVADAMALVQAIFYAAQGGAEKDVCEAICACCNSTLDRLKVASDLLYRAQERVVDE